ncbi:ATP-binding cassette domain-containing protein [Streptomyces sp. NPDC013455]|uniref:ATP-binding cassette domain-containing protein n=1 Tax=Streptomyces sp. NPDC013455 TaxID=3155605 RepID=UPI0033E934D1
MIQAFGLTSIPRKAHPPAVDDLSFEARAGRVTALLGGSGAGKTTTLRLMLELQPGRGITYFRGRPLHRIAHPSREVGVLLGDVPGHPSRTVRGHLRMLCAASGVPARRADEVLEVVGLVSLREERLGTLSRGMDRRLGLACALLPDPHTLVLDEPAEGLSAREAQWMHGMLRAHATQGGTVLFTTADTKEAARTADRVVTLDGGKLVADQEAKEFARTRLRPRVAVRSPHAARLAALLGKEARTARRSVEVVREGGNRLSVYGTTTADVGEIAFRHGILVHQLADEVGDLGPSVDGAGDGPAGSAKSRQAVSGSPSGEREARPAERDTGAPVVAEEREHDSGGRSRAAARASAVNDFATPESAPSSTPESSPAAASGSSPDDSGRAMDETQAMQGPAGPGRARPALPRGDAASGLPSPQPRTAAAATEAGVTAPDPAATGTGADRDFSAPGPGTAPGPSSAYPTVSGHGSGPRGRIPADPSAPEAERATAGPSSADEERGAPSEHHGEAHDGTEPHGTDPHDANVHGGTEPHRTDPHGAKAHGGEPLGAGPREPGHPGPVHDGTASGAEAGLDRPPGPGSGGGGDETPEGAVGGRSADAATAAGNGAGGNAASSGPQTGGENTATTTIVGTRPLLPGARNPATRQSQAARAARPEGVRTPAALSPLPPPISVRPATTPLRPLRYEIRRATGIGTGFLTCGAALAVSALTAVLLARIGHTPQARLFAAWPREMPLPPAALAAGLLGALAFGDEFRHPALAADRGTVPRRLGLLTAKLLVSGATATLLAFLTLGCDAEVLYIVYGRELTEVPGDWLALTASWFGLVLGCAWAGVLAAGVFRSTTAGLAAVLAVPVLVVPLVHKALQGPAVRLAADFPVRLREVHLLQWPFGGERYLLAAARVVAQPVGEALALSLAGLLCAYVVTALRTRFR